MKREQFEEILKADGWKPDRYGHYHKTKQWRTQHVDSPEVIIREPKYRVKLQDRSCRIEVQIRLEATKYSPAKNVWVRLGGDYYSKIVQLDDGRIRVGSIFFG